MRVRTQNFRISTTILPAMAIALSLGLVVGLNVGGAAAGAAAQALSEPAGIDRDQRVSAARAQAINKAAQRFLDQSADQPPGLWLAVWDPKRGYYEQGYGQAVIGDARPGQRRTARRASTNDVLYIGSITKTIFTTAVLRQVARGTMTLNDTVEDLDPALSQKFPTIASVTVRDLVGMTSGIPDYANAAVEQVLGDPNKKFTRHELIALGLASGEQEPIGTGNYSSTNYIILGEMLRKVTQRTPERSVNNVLRKAGLSRSRLPLSGPRQAGGPPAGIAHGYIGAALPADLLGHGLPDANTDVTSWTFSWGKEAGGAYATIGDLAEWGSTCLGNSLLPNKLVRQRLATKDIGIGALKYGLGITREGDWLSHTGQVLGWSSDVACNLKTGAVVAYATNSTNGVRDFPSLAGSVIFPDYFTASE